MVQIILVNRNQKDQNCEGNCIVLETYESVLGTDFQYFPVPTVESMFFYWRAAQILTSENLCFLSF